MVEEVFQEIHTQRGREGEVKGEYILRERVRGREGERVRGRNQREGEKDR